MKKIKVFGLLALILAFGLVFAACGETEQDTWSNPTSLDQINGTWKGIVSHKLAYKEWYGFWGRTWGTQEEEYYGNMSMEAKFDVILAINSATKTNSQTHIETDTFSGGNINSIWEEFKTTTLSGALNNDKNHSATWSEFVNSGNIGDVDKYLENILINQNGNKMKFLGWLNNKVDLYLTKQ